MKIVHFSDWHSQILIDLPEADLYICTGDMYPNLCKYKKGGYFFDVNLEIEYQKKNAKVDEMKCALKNNAPVICVRGNHDFIDLSFLFQKCNLIHEFIDNEIIEFCGKKITGHRGIPEIYRTWNDEFSRADLKDKVRNMPDADLYLTHYAPNGVLDFNYGLEGMADNLLHRNIKSLHCFGHIHECGSLVEKIDDMFFSNAACGFNEIVI